MKQKEYLNLKGKKDKVHPISASVQLLQKIPLVSPQLLMKQQPNLSMKIKDFSISLSFHHTTFLYIFSFHIQTQNIQSVLEQQIKYLRLTARATLPMLQKFLLTSIECKERDTQLQQLPKIIETTFFYSFSGRIFSQLFHGLSASHHSNSKNQLFCFNIFGYRNQTL